MHKRNVGSEKIVGGAWLKLDLGSLINSEYIVCRIKSKLL